jgi:hypothetical protein
MFTGGPCSRTPRGGETPKLPKMSLSGLRHECEDEWANVRGEWANVRGEWANVRDEWANVRGEWANVRDEWANVRDEWANGLHVRVCEGPQYSCAQICHRTIHACKYV